MVYGLYKVLSEFVDYCQDAVVKNNGLETPCLTFAALRALPENTGQPSFILCAKPGFRRVTVSDMVITDIYGGAEGGGRCRRPAPAYMRLTDPERFALARVSSITSLPLCT